MKGSGINRISGEGKSFSPFFEFRTDKSKIAVSLARFLAREAFNQAGYTFIPSFHPSYWCKKTSRACNNRNNLSIHINTAIKTRAGPVNNMIWCMNAEIVAYNY